MRVGRLWLADFRNYASAELILDANGLTVVVGRNGQGKTNLLEAIGYLATLESFRGAPREAMVRQGATQAVVRAEGQREGRELLLEAEISLSGRDRAQVNRQPLRRTRDLLGAIRASVFSPDDLRLIQDGPALRRDLLDGALVSMSLRNDALRSDTERALRQRGALLKQAGGRLTPEVATTLDVWDDKLAELGTALASAREKLVWDLQSLVAERYAGLAGASGAGAGGSGAGADAAFGGRRASMTMVYRRSWEGDLAKALATARVDDVRRGVTTVGPHRDELEITLGHLPARTHASQGEQRCLALALRLGIHALVTSQVGSAPILLLDDVFSELDRHRAAALVGLLPAGQALLTTAEGPPTGTEVAKIVRVQEGRIIEA
jgi:DNA replication and repair protein RecF